MELERVSSDLTFAGVSTHELILMLETHKKALQILDNYVKSVLREGVDYVKYNFSTKPFLLKSGALKIARSLNLNIQTQIVSETLNEEEASVKMKAVLVNAKGQVISEGWGYCSSKEVKYTKQIENEKIKPPALYNTILKMAEKRAVVDAVLNLGLAHLFTQDEDTVEEVNKPQPTQQQKTYQSFKKETKGV